MSFVVVVYGIGVTASDPDYVPSAVHNTSSPVTLLFMQNSSYNTTLVEDHIVWQEGKLEVSSSNI